MPTMPTMPTDLPGVRRDKLGLALSGGGFRASLFHLGVFRRMAELDILRDVEVLSTVSGGSIVSALYVLLLKKEIDERGQLTRDDYIGVVNRLQAAMVKGIQLNLRLRLLMNPLGILRVLLTQHSLGLRMSRLYERYLYAEPVRQLGLPPGRSHKPTWWRPGYIPLRKVWFTPKTAATQGIYRYNAVSTTKLPNLVLNSTSLNSGRSFRFSAAEIGDSRLGLFRWDEIESELEPRKQRLELSPAAIDELPAAEKATPLHRYAMWWRSLQRDGTAPAPAPFSLALLPGPLASCELGVLRHVKIAAWYLVHGAAQNLGAPGSAEQAEWLARFWSALRRVDPFFANDLWGAVAADPGMLAEILECVLQVYYLRSAQAMSPRLKSDYTDLALSEAVGASACFPPVFPPLLMLGIYDDAHVAQLALTDGGVYDNVGTSTLLDEDCNYIIASDTGGLLDVEARAAGGRIGLAGRIPGILMDRVGSLQMHGLDDKRELSALDTPSDGLYGLAYFHIQSPPLPGPGCQTGLDPNLIGHLRTDLDAFGDVEVAALVNHGYDVADRHIRAKLGHSPFARDPALWAPPTKAPWPLPTPPGERETKVLEAGQARFFRALKLGAAISWLFVAAVVAAVLYLTRDASVSVSGIIDCTAKLVIDAVAKTVPVIGRAVVETPISVLFAVAVIGVVVSVAVWGWAMLIDRLRGKNPALARQLAFVAKWTRTYVINVIWLIGLAPIWIALACTVVSVSGYVFFSKPFLSRTKLR